jgi:hypothetical protein
VGIRCADHATHQLKLALTSPTGCGRSVGIVRLRTKTTECEGKELHGVPSHGEEENVKILVQLKEIWHEAVKRIHVAQNRDQ